MQTKLKDSIIEKFYYGTIIIIKNIHQSPKGIDDALYCMTLDSNHQTFKMLDLYRSMGSIIIHELEPNIDNHVAVNKQGIKDWVRSLFEYFYDPEWYQNTVTEEYLDEVIYVSDLSHYFKQVNRDLIMP